MFIQYFYPMTNAFIKKRNASTELILQIGLELFADNGYHPATIRMIAEKAGISLGLLYNYFKSKEEVLLAIFKKNTKDIQAEFLNSKELEPKTTLATFIRQFFKIQKSNRNFWLLYYSIKLSRKTSLLVTQETKELESTMQEILEDCLMAAEIPFPSLEAKFVMASLDGLAQHLLMLNNFPINDLIHLLLLKYQQANTK